MTVNKARVRKLVDALRSGRFAQGEGKLAAVVEGKTKYCCLGVACVIAKEDGVELAVLERTVHGENLSAYFAFDNEAGFMPHRVRDYFGFDHWDPKLKVDDKTLCTSIDENGVGFVNATHANDTLKYNFNKIADLFEETYLADTE